MRTRYAIAALLLIAGLAAAIPAHAETGQERIAWFREAKFGLFLHWGPGSLTGKELSWSRKGARPGDIVALQEIPVETYDSLYKQFNPIRFDAKEWVRIARNAGMKYIVLVTKHHDGFSMFRTAYSDHQIGGTPFGRDVVKELADACHSAGMRFGVYYSQRDWYHPDYLKGDNSKYTRFLHNQVRELLSNYGKVDIVWFDSFGRSDLLKDWRVYELLSMIRRLQPEILVNNRLSAIGSRHEPPLDLQGAFETPEERVGAFQHGRAWESCMTLVGRQWSYRPRGRMYSREETIRHLINTVTGDGNLLLNLGPMPTGELEARQVDRLGEVGEWLRRNGESIYSTRGGPFRNGKWGGATYRGKTVYLHVFEWNGTRLQLPPIQARVLRATLLQGSRVRVQQTAAGIRLWLPVAKQDALDTIVKLELSAPAAQEIPGGAPLPAAEEAAAVVLDSPLEYRVFQRTSWREGRVPVSGRAALNCQAAEVRAVGAGLPGRWQPATLDSAARTFRADLAVPAGGWYRVEARLLAHGKPVARAAVGRVGVGEVFLVAGQSNSSNLGEIPLVTDSGMISTFDGAKWRVADDPQPGVQDKSRGGSFLPAFGDALYARIKVPVGVASVGHGGTSVRQWLRKGDRVDVPPSWPNFVLPVGPNRWECDGRLFEGLVQRIGQLGPRGFRALLWHQGESDANQKPDRQITPAQYRALMEQLIHNTRQRAGWDFPWFAAQATYHTPRDPGSPEIRAAQRALWESGIALEGPDTDALAGDHRSGDGQEVHFSGKGQRAHGVLWAEKVAAWLDTVRK